MSPSLLRAILWVLFIAMIAGLERYWIREAKRVRREKPAGWKLLFWLRVFNAVAVLAVSVLVVWMTRGR